MQTVEEVGSEVVASLKKRPKLKSRLEEMAPLNPDALDRMTFVKARRDQIIIPADATEYQRHPADPDRISDVVKLALKFDPLQFDAPRCIRIDSDHPAFNPQKEKFEVFAGAGRNTALWLREYNGMIPLMVVEGATSAQAAIAIREEDNLTKKQKPHQKLKAGIWGRDRDSLEIQNALNEFGLSIGKEIKTTNVAALYSIAEDHDGPQLRDVLAELLAIWPKDAKELFSAPMLKGMAYLLEYEGDRFGEDQREALRSSLSPGALIAEAKKGAGGGSARVTKMNYLLRLKSGLKKRRSPGHF